MEWTSLRDAHLDDGRVTLEPGDGAQFTSGGLSRRFIDAETNGELLVVLEDSMDHHFIGLTGSNRVAFKLENNVLVPHVDDEPVPAAPRSAYTPGRRLRIAFDERGHAVAGWADECPATFYTFPVSSTGPQRAEFRFASRWPAASTEAWLVRPVVNEPRPPVGDCHAGPLYTAPEVRRWQRRARGDDAGASFHALGDSGANSPAEWNRIVRLADEMLAQGETVTRGPTGCADHHPCAGWDGSGPVPAWSDPFTSGGPALSFGVRALNAAFVSLVEDRPAHREAVRAYLLEQVAVPEVDFSNGSRWQVGVDQYGRGRFDQNPFFILSEWVRRLARAYEYSRYRLEGSALVDSNVYSPADVAAIEGWLRDAGEYFRRLLEDQFLNKFFGGDRARRAANDHRGSFDAPAWNWRGRQYWDGGPYPLVAASDYQNRATTVMSCVALIGGVLDDATLLEDAAFYFREVLRYSVLPDSSVGDWWRSHETGTAYTASLLFGLIEIADVHARRGDASLYELETSDGATFEEQSTAGGPKSLHRMLIAYSRFFRPAESGGWGRTQGGIPLDGYIDRGQENAYGWVEGRSIQSFMSLATANAFYRDAALERFVSSDPVGGYRGLVPPSQDVGWGYPAPPSRGVGETLPGAMFMYARALDDEWAYRCIDERAMMDSESP